MPDIKRVDRSEIARRVERAEKLLQKGKTADALTEYFAVLADDIENDVVRQMAADLCLSLQRTAEAVSLLGELFERQIVSGDATRASLTYKKLARYVTPTWQQKVRFGQLLENINRKQAIEIFESVLDELARQGRKQDSVAVLKRVVALDQEARNFQRLAELLSEVGDSKAAAGAFLRLAEMTTASGGNTAPWYERAYTEDPSDPQIALSYGKNLLAQGEVGAAIFILEALANAGSPSRNFAIHSRRLCWRPIVSPRRSHTCGNCLSRTRRGSNR